MSTIAEKLAYLKETKRLIKEKLIGKGVTITDDDSFRSYADKIDSISSGPDWKQVTDWSYFSNNGGRDSIVQQLKYDDTSNGTNFSYMFNKTNLTTIPLLDTSNGTNFSYMLAYNKGSEMPQICTSNGTNFSYMYVGSQKFTTIPLLDTSNGTNFTGMLQATSKLITIPLLDTSNGTNFNSMFNSSGIQILPEIDTSNGESFSSMFYGCVSLVTVESINVSKMSSSNQLSSMFSYCNSLTNITFQGSIPISTNTSIFKQSSKLTVDSLMSFINALVKTGTADTYTVAIGSTNLAKLSEEQKQIATDKGIILA